MNAARRRRRSAQRPANRGRRVAAARTDRGCTWTSTPPTTPGYYWCVVPEEDCQVVEVTDWGEPEDGPSYWITGSEEPQAFPETARWVGPLAMPRVRGAR